MSSKDDPEIQLIALMDAELRTLDTKARGRVLTWAASLHADLTRKQAAETAAAAKHAALCEIAVSGGVL